MAQINLDGQQANDAEELFSVESELEKEPMENSIRMPSISINDGLSENIESGFTMEEINDPNRISVTVADSKTPLVILFGPPACGKTMTLIRLSRYLKRNGYTVVPEASFRPNYDKNYNEMCTHFDEMINSNDAAESTKRINFMLVKVMKNGSPICQILEGPGEYYFNPENPIAPFPSYVHSIIASDNRKLWAIMVEPSNTNRRMDSTARQNYVDKVSRLKTQIDRRDKITFVYNKIDETPYIVSPGIVRYKLALQDIENHYPGLLGLFKNENPITRFWQPYNFGLIAFQTGSFTDTADGGKTFQEGNNVYPQKLWRYIMKRIRG